MMNREVWFGTGHPHVIRLRDVVLKSLPLALDANRLVRMRTITTWEYADTKLGIVTSSFHFWKYLTRSRDMGLAFNVARQRNIVKRALYLSLRERRTKGAS